MPQEGACARWESRPAAQICSLLAVEPWAGHLPPKPRSCCPLISYMEHGGGAGGQFKRGAHLQGLA